MKQRYTWKEFEKAALKGLGFLPADIYGKNGKAIKYVKIYSQEPEGDHYDFPDFIEIDLSDTTRQ